MRIKFTPDLIVAAVLSVAVIVGMLTEAKTEVLTGLVGGLTTYLGRTMFVDERKKGETEK